MVRKQLLIILLMMMGVFSVHHLQAQITGSGIITDPYVIDNFPTTFSNFNSSGGESASGMGGSCSSLACCSVIVYKVTLPANGVLRMEMTNFTPLAGTMIGYRPLVSNPTSYSDIGYVTTFGNFCGYRDSMQLGAGYTNWRQIPLGGTPTINNNYTTVYDFNAPSSIAGFMPAGDYYILVFNENQQSSLGVGSSTDITFEFAEACAPLTVPTTAQFDTLEPNTGLDTVSFYVKNERTLDVTVDFTNTSITGGDSTDFTVITNPSSTIAVGDSALVQIQFAPSAGGARNSTYKIAFYDTNCSTSSSVTLQGAGAEAEIVVIGNSISITNNDLTPATNNLTNMGAVITNTGSITHSYQIVNTGSDTLELTNNPIVTLNGDPQFVVSNQPSSVVLPGDTTSFEITFTPTTDGTVTTDISIVNNDIDESLFTFRIQATGAERNGLHFDGSNDYVTINAVADDMAGVTGWTVESWIKASTSQSGNDHIIAVNTTGSGNTMLFRLDDGILSFYDGSDSHVAGTDLRDDTWHHVAASYDNGQLALYVDGALQGLFSVGTVTFGASNRWSLGQEYDGSSAGDYFKGALNEVRIWKTVKTAQEISDDRYCEVQSPAANSDLVGYYTLNQGVSGGTNTSITETTDFSSYGNNGTLTNFALTGSTSNFIAATNVGVNCNSVSITVCDATSYTVTSGSTYTSSGVYTDTLTSSTGGDSIVYTDLSIKYYQVTQNRITDTTVCDTIKAAAQTEYTPFATFEKSDENWMDVSGVVGDLVNTNRSIFLWMKAAGQVTGDNQVLVGINSSGTSTITNMMIRSDEELDLYDGSNYQTTNTVVTDGVWHFVGYTYDETTNNTITYIDGVEVDSYTNGQSISATDRISLGQEFDGSTPSNFFDGDMAEVTFWNEVLDSTDIALLMQSSVQSTHPKYANLKAYYPMVNNCGDDGLTVEDFSSNGYDGTASANDIVTTDSLAEISGHNAAPLYTKSWTRNGTQVATTDSLELTGVLQGGTYGLDLNLDYFNVSDSWMVTLSPACSGPVAAAVVDSNVTCNGLSDGGATASATGGTSPYSYLWSNGATTASITGVTSGMYTVTVTDNGGLTDTASVMIIEPTVMVAVSQVDSSVTCNGLSDGGATVSATGGTSPYTYAWSNSATTALITGVVAGAYTVTVTDANGCTSTSSSTVTEPAALVASSIVDSNVSAYGFNDGGATASATGGTMPYAYSWSNGATTASFTGVIAGTYSVTITDSNGCMDTSSVVINQPPNYQVSAVVDSNVTCNGLSDGGTTANVTGGTSPYSYLWSNGAATASITGVTSGMYTVTITDNGGLTDTASVMIIEPTVMVAASQVDSNVTCNGLSDGGATASATGGTSPYTYAWSNSATTASVTGVMAGTYTVTVTDANGCTSTSSSTVTEPAALVAASQVDSNVTCNGLLNGGATASALGGTTPYVYAWSNSATTASITGVTAGTYTVTVTDANGCASTSSSTVTEPTVLVTSSQVDSNVTCNGLSDGGATASATGGTSPYTYTWSNSSTTASITGVMAETYTVTVTDANGCTSTSSSTVTEPTVLVAASQVDSNVTCNSLSDGGATVSVTGGTMPYSYAWSNSATTASITGVAAGTYTVTVTDANGCTSTSSSTVTEPAALVEASQVDSTITCSGLSDGGATASATGGTMPYTYAWSNSATTASITGVMAGTYTVTVTDANGCTSTNSSTVTEPATLVAATQIDSTVSCNGLSDGGATASATGGTMPYTYVWSNAATTASITGVAAGTYSVTITDFNGCYDSASVVVTEPATLIAATMIDSTVSCNGLSDGGVTSAAVGGTTPYTYIWSNGATTASITGVAAGTYSVTITDFNGCYDSASAVVTEPAVLVAASQVDSNVTCNGLLNGGATASATGGTMPYTYAWSNSATTASITGVAAGTYTVTVTDANGCTSTSSSTVTEPTVLVAASQVDSTITCNGLSDGGATASATGGTMPYTYAWSNSATTASITGVAAGTYTVTVTDANGCTSTSSS
ncbi:MAG: hypothetical protein CL843_19890, partial [Crocinitomicaceae bacterium]|nr:hypothetical protein [Crocinitomicaceae bacterium]